MIDIARLLVVYANGVDLDRGFETGLTMTMREAAEEIKNLREEVASLKDRLRRKR